MSSVGSVFCLSSHPYQTEREDSRAGKGPEPGPMGEAAGGSYSVVGMGGLLRSGEVRLPASRC